jgi:nicotinate phosphoribosyltransferase
MQTPIITSLLDTDLYKLTMMQCVFHQFSDATCRYHFKSRKQVNLSPYADVIKAQVAAFCTLTFTQDELDYLAELPFMRSDFIEYLKSFSLNPAYVTVQVLGNELDIVIEGPWLQTILFEVPLLAIVSETYYQEKYHPITLDEGRARLNAKIDYIRRANVPEFRFSDFGTRRRFSKAWQHELIQTLQSDVPVHFQGTSNVWCAKAYGLRPVGTMAHEFLQAAQVLAPSIEASQKFALKTWAKEYPNQLGVALTDVFSMDIFLKDFDENLAHHFEGLRQDSGDPSEWARKAIAHYKKLNIDPHTKRLVFSNGLTFEKAISIYNQFKDETKLFFGIGTNLTNDVGYAPLDIVIKMTHTNQRPVIKISDSPGKTVCEDAALLQHVKSIFNL